MEKYILLGFAAIATLGGFGLIRLLSALRKTTEQKEKDRKGRTIFWIKRIEAEELRKMVLNALETDWDVYEYLRYVNEESSAIADGIRERWAEEAREESQEAEHHRMLREADELLYANEAK